MKKTLFVLIAIFIIGNVCLYAGESALFAQSTASDRPRPVLLYGLKSADLEKLNSFGAFNVFNIFEIHPSSLPMDNPIIQATLLKGSKFLAHTSKQGIERIKATEYSAEKVVEAVSYFEEPLKNGYRGIIFDEVSGEFKDSTVLGKILREAIVKIKQDYPDRLLIFWGASSYRKDYHEIYNTISQYADYFIPEIYVSTASSRAQSQEEIRNLFKDSLNSFISVFPQMSSKLIIGLGFYSTPDSSVDNRPDKDYKVLMEWQLNAIANDSMLNQFGVAVYAYSRLDDSYNQWMVRLLDHYIKRGNTGWIGTQDPNLTYVKNPSFEDELTDSWEVKLGKGGSVNRISNAEAGIANEKRTQKVPQPAGPTGHVLETIKGDAPSMVSQAVMLDLNKVYLLEIFAKKLNEKGISPGDVLVSNARVILYNRELNKTCGWTYYHIVFKPNRDNVRISISDTHAERGDRIVWDFVRVEPYYTIGPA